jgi:hypothetical protein
VSGYQLQTQQQGAIASSGSVEALPDYGPNSEQEVGIQGPESATPLLDEAEGREAGTDLGDCGFVFGAENEVGAADGPADPQLVQFLSMRFAQAGFTPSTGIGNFDVSYVPADGRLTATVNLELFFEGAWTEEEQKHYVAEFRYQIESVWNASPAPIRCRKPGWEGVVATPRIFANAFIEGTGSTRPGYQVTVRRGDRSGGGLNNYRPPVRERWWGPGQLDLDEGQVEDRESGQTVTEAELARVRGLVDGHRLAANRTATGWSLDPSSARELAPLAQKMTPGFPSTPPVPIGIVGWGGTDCMDEVEQGLHDAGARNRLDPGYSGNQPGELSLRVDPTNSYRLNPPRTDFNLAAHEFGHMLGLWDEYEGAELHGVSEEQQRLVNESGAEPIAIDQDTTSVMSEGKDVLPAHYVTLWEALTKLTAGFVSPSQWEL